MKKVIYLLFILTNTHLVNAQIEFSKWYFGYNSGLDFSTSPPTVLTNGSLTTNEGCATICDGGGNLLFYTDGMDIRNSTHNLMVNGTGLFGHSSSTQSGIIVKQPGNSNIYYIFTTGCCGGPANYSVIDMALAASLGSVTIKNATLYSPSCEKQVAVRHCNGKDVWIVSHDYGSNQFRAYLLGTNGISSAVISAVGGNISGTSQAAVGHLKISPDGKRLAMATADNSIPSSLGLAGFYLFDFNAATGVVSNPLTLTNVVSAYGLEFSPDGTKLYGTTPFDGTITATLYQWNICASSTTAIVSSQYSLNLGYNTTGSVQRAIDGKIYIVNTFEQSLNVINTPNAAGAAMGFSFNALSIAPAYSGLGLPNYINPYTKPTLSQTFSNTKQCQSVSFTVPPSPTFTSGCVSTPYAPNGYMWDFGEPSSGSANSSTLSSPSHLYTGLGTYTVSLILVNPCGNDTVKKVITISTAGPNPNVAGTFSICKGERYTYTASGGSSYIWSNNSTATTVPLNPTQTTVYSVASTSNGCTLSKSFTVTVNACLGINNVGTGTGINVWPNPFNTSLNVEVMEPTIVKIYDLQGRLILRSTIETGINELNTTYLQNGIYLINIDSKTAHWQSKLVKVE